MKKFCLAWVGFAWVCLLSAQTAYMNVFRATGAARADLNELASGNLLSGFARQSGFSLISPAGEFIHSHCYAIDTLLAIQSVQKYADNVFYFSGGYYKDTCTSYGSGSLTRIHPVIGRADSLGNVLDIHHYSLSAPSCSNIAGKIEIMQDGGAIALSNEASMFALRVDASGALLWAKHFGNHGGFAFIKELPNGGLIAGINTDTAGAVVARLDPDGNFLWCRSYIRPSGVVSDCVVGSDGSFIVTGFTDSLSTSSSFVPLPAGYDPKLFLMKLDGSGEVQWCRGYGVENTWYVRNGARIVSAQNDTYVLLANLGSSSYNSVFRPFLMNTDQNGDTLWTRSWGAEGYTYDTRDLLAYSDGGYVISGRIYGPLPEGQASFAYLFKTDAQGALPCDEQREPLHMVDLFPVDSSFTLYSIDGAEARPAFISDADFPPITTYDACVISSVVEWAGTANPRIRPNPNTGRFTVQFKDPLMADSYYGVYDTMGKLLLQRRLPTGATVEEVDLTRFGAGTYVIRFTSPDGVRHERVVVE